MERLALPVFQSRISPVLDTCNTLTLVDLTEAGAVRRAMLQLKKLCPAERAAAMSRRGVQIIICAGVSEQMMACIANRGMRVVSGISGEVAQVITAYQKNQLDQERFRMPGGKKSKPSPRAQGAVALGKQGLF